MKYVVIKVYDACEKCGLHLIYENYKEQRRLIDREIYKTFDNMDALKIFLNNLELNKDYAKAKILLDYIHDEVIIENINVAKENTRSSKGLLKAKLDSLYPNNQLSYTSTSESYFLQNHQRCYVSMLSLNEKKSLMESYFETLGGKKVYGYFDHLMLQNYLNKSKAFNDKKHYLIIQIENKFWRYTEVINGKIVNYLILYEEMAGYEHIRKNIDESIDRRYDEIIIDADFKTYIALSDLWQSLNIVFIEYSDKFKYLDERKLVYAYTK